MAYRYWLAIGIISFFSCKKSAETTPAQTIVGSWQWVRAYNVGFDPSTIGNTGPISFYSDGRFKREPVQQPVDTGYYSVTFSTYFAADSIEFTRTVNPQYPVLDYTWDLASRKGDSLYLGLYSSEPLIFIYGVVNVYHRAP